jgi:isoquinoline 1-oxidoreductase alpha subunit
MNDQAVRSCSITVSQASGTNITTIEGLATSEEQLHPVQEAWMQVDVPQCGYCQAGQIMAASAMLKRIPKPTDEDIDNQMTNICRCGTYVRVRQAIKIAADKLATEVT